MTRRFSYPQAFWRSFFSKELYRDVAYRWEGIGFGYLFTLILLAVVVLSFRADIALSQVLGGRTLIQVIYDGARELVSQWPPSEIRGEQLIVRAPQPYSLYFHLPADQKRVGVIIDTTGHTASLEHSDAFVLLTGKQIFIKKGKGRYEMRDYGKWPDGQLNRDVLTSYVDRMAQKWNRNAWWLGPLVGLAFISFFILPLFIYRLLQALLYGGIGMLFAKAMKLNVTYQTMVRLTCVALTPPVVLWLVAEMIVVQHVPGLLFLALGLGYVYFALFALKEEPIAAS